jgi:YebC/PmpR family DNA-binding regulatory protein
MSGHSKWSTIKHQKGAADVRRGALFTKLSRDIYLAVREGGGGDPDMNFRLRLAVDKAKSSNMPLDGISRAIKRGTGEGGGPGEELEEVIYEGYGPGGVAILLEALTDNRNRTASDVRSTFNKGGGALGEAGCVAWNFETKGVITLQVSDPTIAEHLALMAIDSGAEDVDTDGDVLEIHTSPEVLQEVGRTLEGLGVIMNMVEIAKVPKNLVLLEPDEAERTLKLLENLEDLTDVQKTYTTADFPPEVLQQYQAVS